MGTPASRKDGLAEPYSITEPVPGSPSLSDKQPATPIEAANAPTKDASPKALIEKNFRHPLLYEPPDSLPAPAACPPKIGWKRRTLALTVAAALLYITLDYAWSPRRPYALPSQGEDTGEPAELQTASLIVREAPPTRVDQLAPLGVSIENANDLTFLFISELPKGTTISAGHAVADYGWSLYATEIKDVLIRPPPHFVGIMKLTASLIAGPGVNIMENRPLRFEWVAEKAAPTSPPSDAPSVAQVEAPSVAQLQAETPPKPKPASQTIVQLAPEETAALLKRGNALVLSGDLAAARLVLRRAAEAGNARAAFVLAGTYNPITLKELQVHGLAPDMAAARYWYEKAHELGSPDALPELQILTARQK